MPFRAGLIYYALSLAQNLDEIYSQLRLSFAPS